MVQAYLWEDEVSCGGYSPSDGAFAVNLLYLVQVPNSCISIRDATTGNRYSIATLNSFFGFPSTDLTGDPRTIYDQLNSKFIVTAIDFTGCPTTLGVAVSKTNNPRDGWFVYKVGMGGSGDFDELGQTLDELGDQAGAIYSSWNLFDCTTGAFDGVVIDIFGKTDAYAGTSLSGSSVTGITFGGVLLDTVQPVSVTGRSDRPRTEYLVSAANNANPLPSFCSSGHCNGYYVISISHGISSGGPVFSAIAVSAFNKYSTFNYTIPGPAHQKGATSGSCLIDTGDNRISSEAYYQSGNIYFAHSVGTAVGSATHISQFQPILSTTDGAAATITGGILQNDFCFGCGGQGTNGSNYYPGIVPDPEGNFTLVYDFSDDNHYPEVSYLSNRVSYPRGSVHDQGFVLQGGASTYCKRDDTGRNRWGDYTGTAPLITTTAGTPLVPLLTPFWFWGQYSEAQGSWGTAIGRNGYRSVDQVGY